MANFCYYDIRIKGRRSHALLLCNSLPTLDGGSFYFSRGNDEEYELHFHAACKWSLDAYVKSSWNGKELPDNLDALSEDELLNLGMKCMWYSLREKSRVLKCVVMAHSWSDESDFDCFEHYDKGECIDYSNDEYNPEYVFDWNQMDYVPKASIPQPLSYEERIKVLWDAKLPELKAAVPFDHIPSISCQGKEFVLIGLSEHIAFKNLGIDLQNPMGTLPTGWWIEKNGGLRSKRVTLQTDYLIAGIYANPASGAIKTAMRYRDSGKTHIKILSEDELLRMLNGETLEIPAEYQQNVEAREAAIKQAEDLKQQTALEKLRLAEEAKQRRTAQRQAAKAAQEQSLAEMQQKRREAKHEAFLQRQGAEQAAKEEAQRQKAEERAMKLATDVLYRPGEEPTALKTQIANLFEKLDNAYPDKQISSLQAEHKKWSEKANEIRKLLGYPDSQAFLEAYGYTVVNSKGGRPSTVDPETIIEELKRRYPNGGCKNVAQLKNDNSDLPIKTLVNNAQKLFGMSLGDYLKKIGVLG